MCLKFTECDPLHLIAVVGIIAIEFALIITGNDGAYAVPLVGSICLIIGVKIPENKLNDLLSIVLKK
jgi:hypothetical protein